MDFRQLLEQAQMLQGQVQDELQRVEVSAESGGGLVRARMNGKKEILSLQIDPDALSDGDFSLLQDLVIAAVNQCGRRVDESLAGRIGNIASRLGTPG